MNWFTRLVSSAVIVATIAGAAAEEKEPKPSKEDAFLLSLSTLRLDEWITKIRATSLQDRARIIRAVRENRSGRWVGELNTIYANLLMLLGDPLERKKEIARFREIPWSRAELVRMGEPWIIEEIAPDMFRKDKWGFEYRGDNSPPPLSYGAASLIIENLRNATIYQPEVVQWAIQTNNYDYPALRGVMREWWRANEWCFRGKIYESVKPGRPLPKRVQVERTTIESKPAVGK